MMTKEDFNKVWKDSSRESILNQYYYDYQDLRKCLKILDKIKEYIEKELLPSHNIKTTDWEFDEVYMSDLPVEALKPIIELLEEIE